MNFYAPTFSRPIRADFTSLTTDLIGYIRTYARRNVQHYKASGVLLMWIKYTDLFPRCRYMKHFVYAWVASVACLEVSRGSPLHVIYSSMLYNETYALVASLPKVWSEKNVRLLLIENNLWNQTFVAIITKKVHSIASCIRTLTPASMKILAAGLIVSTGSLKGPPAVDSANASCPTRFFEVLFWAHANKKLEHIHSRIANQQKKFIFVNIRTFSIKISSQTYVGPDIDKILNYSSFQKKRNIFFW